MNSLIFSLLLSQSFVQDVPCRQPKDSVVMLYVLTDGGSYGMPATPLVGRRFVEICNSERNASTAIFTCRIDADGGVPKALIGSPGTTIARGGCKSYEVPNTTVIKCVTDTSDAGMTVQECK